MTTTLANNSNYIQTELFTISRPLAFLSSSFTPRFTFVDLFAGIGGFRIALERLGGRCLGYSEIDKSAIEVYQKNFISYANRNEKELGDITKLERIPFAIDILTGGVPCQPWSIAGKLGGFQDPRGRLWFDAIRLVESNKPKIFIFENVKGLTEPRNKEAFDLIISKLIKAEYHVNWKVINAYDFGLPQDRDRVFIVGIRTDLVDSDFSFRFPEPLAEEPKLFNFVEKIQKVNFTKQKFDPQILFENGIPSSRGRFQKPDELNDFFVFSDIRNGHTTIHSWDLTRTKRSEKLICETILKNRRKKKYGNKDGNPLSFEILQELIHNIKQEDLDSLIAKNILRFIDRKGYEFVNSKISSGINGVAKIFLPHSNVISTLTASGTRDYVAKISIPCQEPSEYKKTFIREISRKKRFKKLTARDAAKLQGFPDWLILPKQEDEAKKLLGNAVPVPVVYHLAKATLQVLV
jgi:DNA (cytosine-5)-methyltransferase 1